MPEAFGLYLILTDPRRGYESCARAAVAEGVRYLQLRMKDRPREEVFRTALFLREITAGTGTRLIVNDLLDVAMQADADGVHLGQEDLSLEEARRRWNAPTKTMGLSTHNEVQAEEARLLDPDYVGVGPVFPTPTKKKPDPVLGPERASRIIRASPLTTVAIGGINEENLASLIELGISNFAVVRAVCGSEDPQGAIARLQEIWVTHH